MPQNPKFATGPSSGMAYQAYVMPDTSVILVAETPGVGVLAPNAAVQTIQLTADEYNNLHEMIAATDQSLVYIDGQFQAQTIATIS
jgi:hypothetical protein